MKKKDFSVPIEIRKHKPKGTMVKKISGCYYVYEYKNVKDESTGKWKIKMGKLIGTIKEGIGFISNTDKNKLSDATVFEYGQYAMVIANTKETLNKLKNTFNTEEAHLIYLIAVIHLVNSFVYLKSLKEYYDQSYLSIKYPKLKFGYNSISTLIESLGRNQKNVEKFQQELIASSSGNIAIDGHVIKNCSKENDLAAYGNKYSNLKDMQINVLMAYDIDTNKPLTSKIYNGGMLDKTSVKELLEGYEFNNTLFIVDRGFYSKENMEIFSKGGNRYIIPLAENLVSYKKVVKDINFKERFVYQKGKNRAIIEYKEFKNDGNRIIVYRDINQNTIEKEDYFSKIGINDKFTEENYQKLKEEFGLIVLQTNLAENIDPKGVYLKYKERWKIETFFNYFKNKAGFESLYQENYYKTQGLAFVMLIVGLLYEEVQKKLKKENNKSLSDCLLDMRKIKMIKRNDKLQIANATETLLQELKKLGVDISEETRNM